MNFKPFSGVHSVFLRVSVGFGLAIALAFTIGITVSLVFSWPGAQTIGVVFMALHLPLSLFILEFESDEPLVGLPAAQSTSENSALSPTLPIVAVALPLIVGVALVFLIPSEYLLILGIPAFAMEIFAATGGGGHKKLSGFLLVLSVIGASLFRGASTGPLGLILVTVTPLAIGLQLIRELFFTETT